METVNNILDEDTTETWSVMMKEVSVKGNIGENKSNFDVLYKTALDSFVSFKCL